MNITFLNHSSVQISLSSGLNILTDPWFFSKVFCDSWMLLRENTKPVINSSTEEQLIFISHEHPDHLNFPTLRKYFPGARLLLRRDVRPGILAALNKLKFNYTLINTNEVMTLPSGDKIAVFTYHGDSALYVSDSYSRHSILNYNDCEFDRQSIDSILEILPSSVSIVAGQFGLAGYYANSDQPSIFYSAVEQKISRLISISSRLSADIVLPFASYAFFCLESNCHINSFQPSLSLVNDRISSAGLSTWIPYINETLDLSDTINKSELASPDRFSYWNIPYSSHQIEDDRTQPVSFSEISSSVDKLLKRLSKLSVSIPNIDFKIKIISGDTSYFAVLNLFKRSLILLPSSSVYDFSIPAKIFEYSFLYRWGADTLNVSGTASVRSLEKYRSFCCTLDFLLKKVYQ